MKAFFFLLSGFLLFNSSVKAEYNGWYIKFKIITQNQEELIGNIYIAQAYFEKDSIKNSNYLIERFNTLDNRSEDSLVFYKNLLSYKYKQQEDTNTYTEYGLINQSMIAIQQIKSIEVLNMIDFWYLSGIASTHTIADTIWMKSKPIKVFRTGGTLCDWQIFVHETSENTEKTIIKIEELQRSFSTKIEALEADLEYLDGEEYYQTKEKIENLEEKIDSQFQELLSPFKGKKVVIISFCSC